MKRLFAVSALAIFTLLGAAAAARAPGDLDPAFGSGGKVIAGIGAHASWAQAVLIQPDGKIVVGGVQGDPTAYAWGFGLARFNRDGSLDQTFGSGGTVAISFGSSAWIDALALQPDGKIIAAGWTDKFPGEDFALARFDQGGSLDPTFGDSGRVTTDFTGIDEGNAVVVQPDGRIVVAGQALGRFALARYLPDGSLDPTFGNGGRVVSIQGGGGLGGASALLLQRDGKLVAGGGYFALVRFKPDGSPDPTFGTNGVTDAAVGPATATLNAAVLQPDGKIIGAGLARTDNNGEFGLARWNVDGTLDKTFGHSGTVLTPRAPGGAVAVAIQRNGKIVATGSYPSNGSLVTLVRYRRDGTLDRAFGYLGIATASYGSEGYNDAAALALQRDGKIVVAGRSALPSSVENERVGLVRFLGGNACFVPRVVGKLLEAARRTLVKAGCSPGKVTRRFSASVKRGRVVSQQPRPGARLAAATRVSLVVSNGKRRR